MEHMNDDLLLEILCRLSCYRTAIQCKTVSKRWCSVISNPFFVAKGFSLHREIKEKKRRPWTLFLTIKTLATPYILSLNFLPNNHPFKVVTTFRDLVLCYSSNPSSQVGVYTVCNPLTKQWIALPPLQTYEQRLLWAGLVCQEGHGFRVIVLPSIPSPPSIFANKDPFKKLNLVIYLSETGQWKKIDVKIPIRPYDEGHYRQYFAGVVCKGMVCIRHYRYFGAFNPFDVTPTFCGNLRAIGLPLPRMRGKFLESCGKLVLVDGRLDLKFLSNENHEAQNYLRWPVLKLDLKLENDEQHHRWEMVSTLFDRVKVTGSIVAQCGIGDRAYAPLNVHPNKEHLVYLITRLTSTENQLVLCNTKSQTLKLLSPRQFFGFKKLDFSCWPMPIPGVLA